MDTKTQILTNILLTLCFAFVVHVSLETQNSIKKIQDQMNSFDLRDEIYFKAKMRVIESIEKQIEEDERNNSTYSL